jgi:hypothetical protein
MGFGAIIASGDGNTVLGEALAECLIEARVEQTLDEPARFGIRVREDFSAGEPMAARAPELQVQRMITIAVQNESAVVGLVRGPITDTQSQYTLGGPGSWYEVHGGDRRVELSRQSFQHVWEGLASDAARRIVESNGFTADVQDTDRRYARNGQTLNQRGTDLDFLKSIARENGYFFWLSLDVRVSGNSLQVDETAHFRTSPFRALGPGGIPPSIAGLALVPDGTPTIRAGTADECAHNVSAFEVREDVERPNAANISAVDATSLNSDRTNASDPQTALQTGGATLTDVTGLQRTLSVTSAGNAEDVRGRAAAALADAGWYLNAHASTTAHMLKGVLQPHDIVSVQGIGTRHSASFRVKKVTHVITPADHYMDIELQSNSHLGS